MLYENHTHMLRNNFFLFIIERLMPSLMVFIDLNGQVGNICTKRSFFLKLNLFNITNTLDR